MQTAPLQKCFTRPLVAGLIRFDCKSFASSRTAWNLPASPWPSPVETGGRLQQALLDQQLGLRLLQHDIGRYRWLRRMASTAQVHQVKERALSSSHVHCSPSSQSSSHVPTAGPAGEGCCLLPACLLDSVDMVGMHGRLPALWKTPLRIVLDNRRSTVGMSLTRVSLVCSYRLASVPQNRLKRFAPGLPNRAAKERESE